MAALAAGLTWAAPVQADASDRGRAGEGAGAPTAPQGDFAGRVAVRGGLRLYLSAAARGA